GFSDAFNYAGGDYAFNAKLTSLSAWYAQLEDIYNQRFLGLKHSEPLGSWTLGANLGFYDSQEDGSKLAGEIDNRAFYSLLSARHGGHTFYVG
ncbi:OprD family outer membrane porin, partial [Klebsiella pneumoniae]